MSLFGEIFPWLLLLIAGVGAWSGRRHTWFLAAIILLPLSLYGVAGLAGKQFGHPRNFAYLSPAYLWLYALGVVTLCRSNRTALLAVTTCTALALTLWSATTVYPRLFGSLETQAVFDYAAHRQEECVMVEHAPMQRYQYEYYAHLYSKKTGRLFHFAPSAADFQAQWPTLLARCPRLLIVHPQGQADWSTELDPQLSPVEQGPFSLEVALPGFMSHLFSGESRRRSTWTYRVVQQRTTAQ